MKRLKVFLVVFLAALMLGIGTGITTVQAYRTPEQNCLALGVSLLMQGQGSAVANPSDAKTVAGIKNGSLTLQENDESLSLEQIEGAIQQLQTAINCGFEKWLFQKPSRILQAFQSLNDNDASLSLLIRFLDEKPEYQEMFKEFTMLQTRKHDILQKQKTI